MDLVFLFYQEETAETLSQVNLFYPALVVIVSLNMVCPAFAFLNTSSVFFFPLRKISFKLLFRATLIIGSLQLWKSNKAIHSSYFSQAEQKHLKKKKRINLFFYNCPFNKLFV